MHVSSPKPLSHSSHGVAAPESPRETGNPDNSIRMSSAAGPDRLICRRASSSKNSHLVTGPSGRDGSITQLRSRTRILLEAPRTLVFAPKAFSPFTTAGLIFGAGADLAVNASMTTSGAIISVGVAAPFEESSARDDIAPC